MGSNTKIVTWTTWFVIQIFKKGFQQVLISEIDRLKLDYESFFTKFKEIKDENAVLAATQKICKNCKLLKKGKKKLDQEKKAIEKKRSDLNTTLVTIKKVLKQPKTADKSIQIPENYFVETQESPMEITSLNQTECMPIEQCFITEDTDTVHAGNACFH